MTTTLKTTTSLTWFVTGCDKGIGRATAEVILARGHRLLMTVLDPSGHSDLTAQYPQNCRSFHLDVTNHNAVRRIVAEAEGVFEGIDVLVNNAGYGLVGAAEETSETEYRRLFDVNFFGMSEVTRAVLSGMRQRRRGHIINFSSAAGFCGYAGLSYYCASKFAVEGYSEALALEVEPLGLRVTLVEPGGFRTDFAGGSLARAQRQIDDYAATAGAYRGFMQQRHGQQPGDPARLGAALCELAEMSEPPHRVPFGRDAFGQVQQKVGRVAGELETWRELSYSTDFPD